MNGSRDKNSPKQLYTLIPGEMNVPPGITVNQILEQNYHLAQQNTLLHERLINYEKNEFIIKHAALNNCSRRRKADSEIISNEKGELLFIQNYSDGFHEAFKVFKKLPVLQVASLSSPSLRQNDEYFLMIFADKKGKAEDAANRIILLPRKVLRKGSDLLDSLELLGITMNSRIRKTDLCSAFRKFVNIGLREDREQIVLSPLAGWTTNGLFLTRDTFFVETVEELDQDFPVITKGFPRHLFTEEKAVTYQEEMNQVADIDLRYFLAIFPIVSLLYSLLQKVERRPRLMLNLLCGPDLEIRWICDWLQVFNREKTEIYDGGDTLRHLENTLARNKDEISIIDCRSQNFDPRGRRDNIRNNMLKLAGYVSGSFSLINREEVRGPVVLLSNIRNPEKSVISIELPNFAELSREIHVKFINSKCLEAFLSSLIDYIERNYTFAKELLASPVKVSDPLQVPFAATEKVVNSFLTSLGYSSFRKTLAIPDDYDPWRIIDEYAEDFDAEKIIRDLLRAVMPNLTVCEKTANANFYENCVYFDDDNLFVPSAKLFELFSIKHQAHIFRRTLRDLKDAGWLESPASSYTVKLQISGERRDYYRLNRAFLSEEAQVDIISLACTLAK